MEGFVRFPLSSDGLDVLRRQTKRGRVNFVRSRVRTRRGVERKAKTHSIPNPVVGDETDEGRDGLGSDESGGEAVDEEEKGSCQRKGNGEGGEGERETRLTRLRSRCWTERLRKATKRIDQLYVLKREEKRGEG